MDTGEKVPVSRLMDFSGKVALVTGAGGGIGAQIAQRFAEAGADLCIHYRSSEEGARTVERNCRSYGSDAVCIQGELTDSDDVHRLIEGCTERYGRIDILVNNAGIYPLSDILEMSEEQWDTVLDTDLKSVFLCTKAAATVMKKEKKGGVIINIASIEGENPAPSHSHYCSAKAGVIMFSRASAKELSLHGIRVNSVSPGLIWYEGLEESWPDGVERYTAASPLGRIGSASDVADACLFLASPGASWITGTDLRVDGGIGTSTGY